MRFIQSPQTADNEVTSKAFQKIQHLLLLGLGIVGVFFSSIWFALSCYPPVHISCVCQEATGLGGRCQGSIQTCSGEGRGAEGESSRRGGVCCNPGAQCKLQLVSLPVPVGSKVTQMCHIVCPCTV